jgi:hypothetical protein
LDRRYGVGNYDKGRALNLHRKNFNLVNLKKSSEIVQGKTKITLKVIPIKGLKNFTVYEEISKELAQSTEFITFSTEPEIIESDPLVAWHFSELKQPADLSYEVSGEYENAEDLTSTSYIAEDTTSLNRPWFFNFLPLLAIPILGLVFILLVQMTHRRK